MNQSKHFIYVFFAIGILLIVTLACGSGKVTQTSATPAPEQEQLQQTESKTEESNVEPTFSPEEPTPIQFTNTPEPTPIPPTPTIPVIGMSRSNPFQRNEIVSAPNWDVQVLEFIRGEQAWVAIQAANMFNEPPPDGMEYVLIKLHVKSTYNDSEEHSIGGGDFYLTGDRLTRYSSSDVTIVEPDPILDARLFTGGETEGWVGFMVGIGEGNLVLIVNELFNFDENRFRFIALDDGASIDVSADLKNIMPNDIGKERNNPSSITEKVVTEDWEINVIEVVRGDEAWRMVQEANQFNEPPSAGMEYIAIKVYVRYIGTEDKWENITGHYFKTTGSANVLYDLPMVVDPSPPLDITLYPGGEYEGWVVVQAAEGETNLTLVFEPLFDFTGKNKRFISIEP